MHPRTLIIIPAYNEEQSLPGVLRELRMRQPGLDVLVVDDGSSDATTGVATREGAVVATLPFNLGVGGALRTGFRYAVRHGYDRAVQFDADGQHDAAEIGALLAELDRGADMVVGSRFAAKTKAYRAGVVRSGAMRVLRIALNLLTGHEFTDASSGFRAFSRPVLENFARTYPVEYLSDSAEALLLAVYAGYKVVETPVVMHKRAAGVPSTRNLKLIYHYCRVLLVLLSRTSLRNRAPRRNAA